MPLPAEQKEKLDDLQFMLGEDAGRLAMVMEQMTDALALIGQHTVHCRVEKGPRSGEPPLDVIQLVETLQNAKTLVQETMLRLKQ